MAHTSPEPPGEEEQTFESAMERLENLVEEMESEKLPLEKLMVSYEEGLKLVRLCSEKLADAEKRIEIIARGADGKPRLAEFDPAPLKGARETPRPAEKAEPGDVSLF